MSDTVNERAISLGDMYTARAVAGYSDDRLSGEKITVSTTAIALTTIPATANAAVIQVQAQPVCWVSAQGATPTATTGFLAAANDMIYLNSRQQLEDFKIIRQGGTDATIWVEYIKKTL